MRLRWIRHPGASKASRVVGELEIAQTLKSGEPLRCWGPSREKVPEDLTPRSLPAPRDTPSFTNPARELAVLESLAAERATFRSREFRQA